MSSTETLSVKAFLTSPGMPANLAVKAHYEAGGKVKQKKSGGITKASVRYNADLSNNFGLL